MGTGAEIAPAYGVIEPQASGPFSTASVAGTFMLGTELPTASLQIAACNCWNLTLESGAITAASGSVSGAVDESGPSGLSASQTLNFTYAISPDGSGNVGSNTTAILLSGSKLVFINNVVSTPTITVVEK